VRSVVDSAFGTLESNARHRSREWHAHALLQHFHCIKPVARDWLRASELKPSVKKISESHQLQWHTHRILPASHTHTAEHHEGDRSHPGRTVRQPDRGQGKIAARAFISLSFS